MVGNFDESDVIDSLLPACLKNGANPDSFNSGLFPMYTGPQGLPRTATLVNFEPPYGYVKDKGAIRYDGVHDQLNMSANVLAGLPTASLSAWVEVANNGAIIYNEKSLTNSFGFAVMVNTDGKLGLFTRNTDNAVATSSVSDLAVPKNTLIHVIAVYDSVHLQQRIYVNGLLAAVATPISGALSQTRSELPKYGYFVTIAPNALNGYLHCSVLYKKALSDDDAMALYNLGPDLGGLELLADGTLIPPGPTITTQPINDTAIVGTAAEFAIEATGEGTLHYQWYKNNVGIGSDSATLSFITALDDDGYEIYCDVSDDNGTTKSDVVTVSVTARVLTTILVIPTKIAFLKTKQMRALFKDQLGESTAATPVWTIDATTYGTIDANTGVLTAKEAVGEIEVTATVGELSNTATVRVVERISATQPRTSIALGVKI